MVKVERRGFDGEVSLALEGVPVGVIATVQPVAAKAKEDGKVKVSKSELAFMVAQLDHYITTT